MPKDRECSNRRHTDPDRPADRGSCGLGVRDGVTHGRSFCWRHGPAGGGSGRPAGPAPACWRVETPGRRAEAAGRHAGAVRPVPVGRDGARIDRHPSIRCEDVEGQGVPPATPCAAHSACSPRPYPGIPSAPSIAAADFAHRLRLVHRFGRLPIESLGWAGIPNRDASALAADFGLIASSPRHRARPRLVSSTPRSGVRRCRPRIRAPRPASTCPSPPASPAVPA